MHVIVHDNTLYNSVGKTNKNFRETAKLEGDLTFFGFNKYSYSVSSLHITALVLFAVEYE